jgi:hypothetical protein
LHVLKEGGVLGIVAIIAGIEIANLRRRIQNIVNPCSDGEIMKVDLPVRRVARSAAIQQLKDVGEFGPRLKVAGVVHVFDIPS